MRRAALSALLLAAALVLQLTVVNRLQLPGGSTPDLVLLMVIAIALCGGPETGMIAGFCGGLSLDLAPPASQLIGQYALVFCVIGYGCGKLRGTLRRSALLPLVIAAGAAGAGEALSAGVGLALDPAQVTWATVRQVLPFSVLCDVVISSPVLYLAMLAYRWADDRVQDGSPEQRPAGSSALLARASAVSGTAAGSRRRTSWLAGPRGPKAAGGAAAWRSPRPAAGAARLRGGWVSRRKPAWQASAGRQRRPAAPRLRPAAPRLRPAAPRLRPGAGAAGSAARLRPARTQPSRTQSSRTQLAGSHHPVRIRPGRAQRASAYEPGRRQPGRPVNLRLAAGRRPDGKVSSAARRARGAGAARRALPRIAFSGRSGRVNITGWPRGPGHGTFGPGTGRPARSPGFRPPAGARGGSAADGRLRSSAAARPARRRLHLRPRGARYRDGVVGGGLLTGRKLGGRRRQAVAVKFGAGRPVRFGPGRLGRFAPGRLGRFGPGRLGRSAPGRLGRSGPRRPIRFRSGHGSVLSLWTSRRAGRRSSVRRVGSRRTGGSG